MSNTRKVVIRTDDNGFDAVPKHIQAKVRELTELKLSSPNSAEYKNPRPDEKTIDFHKRQIEMIDKEIKSLGVTEQKAFEALKESSLAKLNTLQSKHDNELKAAMLEFGPGSQKGNDLIATQKKSYEAVIASYLKDSKSLLGKQQTIENRKISADEKHITHYEQRIDAIDRGVTKLLNSFDVQGPGREKLNTAFAELKQQKFGALKKIEAQKTEEVNALKKELQEFERGLQNQKIYGLSVAAESRLNPSYAAQLREDIKIKQAENDRPGDIKPYQDILGNYLFAVKKLLHEDALIPKHDVIETLSIAENYAVLEEGRATLCTVTHIPPDAKHREGTWLIQVEVPQDPLSDSQKLDFLTAVEIMREKREKDYQHLPEWYKVMPDIEQKLFLDTFKSAKTPEDIGRIAQSISSKHRTIPGVANFLRHTAVLMDNRATEMVVNMKESGFGDKKLEEGELYSQEIAPISVSVQSRLSHVASRDLDPDDIALRQEFAQDNIEQVANNMLAEQVTAIAQSRANKQQNPGSSKIVVPFLMQTLITPGVPGKPDGRLMEDRDAAIANLRANKAFLNRTMYVTLADGRREKVEVELKIIATNHPLNPGRKLGWGTGTSNRDITRETKEDELSTNYNKSQIHELLKLANQQAHEGNSKLLPLITALSDALKLSYKVDDKELYIAALEQIITKEMNGIPSGSCVSGKDRKGILTIYTDTMQQHYDETGEIPPPAGATGEKKNQRDPYVKRFTGIYNSGHQQNCAGQNTGGGSNGLKTPTGYLPADIAKDIKDATNNPNVHNQCDRLASNNELSKVKLKDSEKAKSKKLDKSTAKMSSSAGISAQLAGGTQEAKAALGKPIAPGPSPEEKDYEAKLVQEIKTALLKDNSIKNATGVTQLIKCLNQTNPPPSLKALGKICLERFDKSHTRWGAFKNKLIKSRKTRQSLNTYNAIINLVRNPKSESARIALNIPVSELSSRKISTAELKRSESLDAKSVTQPKETMPPPRVG